MDPCKEAPYVEYRVRLEAIQAGPAGAASAPLERDICLCFPADTDAGGAGVACCLPPIRGARFSSPLSAMCIRTSYLYGIYLTAKVRQKTTSAALFSSQTAQELQCVQGPHSPHRNTCTLNSPKMYAAPCCSYACPQVSAVVCCILLSGSGIFLFLDLASLKIVELSISFVSNSKARGHGWQPNLGILGRRCR